MRIRESLFDRALDSGALDKTYVHIRDSKYCHEDRDYLDAAWAIFRDHADPEFLTEFRRPGQFQSRAWELRIAWTLRDVGLNFVGSRPGPDFAVGWQDRTIHIEAIAPHATDYLLANYEASAKFGATVPNNEMILRYTAAIREKMQKLATYLSKGIVASDAPYVIALSGANIPQSSIDDWPFPRILKPLFAIGEPYLTVPIGGEGKSETGVHRLEERKTARGSPVPCNIFLADGNRQLSAVIFSAFDIKNRPESRGRPPGHDLLLIHNPHALNPVPEGLIPRGLEWGARAGYLEMLKDWRPSEAA